jgi:hypothetical protein
MRWRIALCVGLLACVAASSVNAADPEDPVYFSRDGCNGSALEPEVVVLTCADGKASFEVDAWTHWDNRTAQATGKFRHPDCAANVPLVACKRYASDEATLNLWRPVYCAKLGRWQFTRLLMEDLTAPTPATRQFRVSYTCSSFSSEPSAPVKPRKFFLGKGFAARLMRNALLRRPALSFQAGYARHVVCGKRLAPDQVKCAMSWFVGDLAFSGRGSVWMTYPEGRNFWNFSYRVVRFDEYCAAVIEGNDCTKTIVAR